MTPSSLLNTQVFLDHFRPALEQGLDVVYVGLSAGISGTYQAACIAAAELRDEFPERTVCPVDSMGAGFGTGLLACRHDGSEGLRQELYLVVDNGGIVEDVKVESPLYGEITGRLHVASRYDADNFVARAMEQPDGLLLRLTGGVHLHTLVCPDEETFLRIRRALAQAGILYEK